MDCPVCKNAMITLELSDVEIDYCTGCNGIWLDAGELDMLLEDRDKAEKLINSFAVQSHHAEARRKCPICLKKMQKVIVGTGEPALLIDKCPKGDGLWFDKGELRNILTAGAFNHGNKVVKLLSDMFGS